MSDETQIITGADDAIVGVITRCGQPPMVVYSYQRLVDHFVADGMTEEEAAEWIDFNIVGAWTGAGTPGVLMDRSTAAYADIMGDDEGTDAEIAEDDEEHIGDDEDEDEDDGLDPESRAEIERISREMTDEILSMFFVNGEEPSENGKHEPKNDEDDGA